jgi:mRNA-degrading endonuclease RelE of RelBE toxin-antitoxin system
MDKIKKALENLSHKEKLQIKAILLIIKTGSFSNIDIKKLKNCENIYRIRKGKLRIIFKRHENGQYSVLAVERRSDKTYNSF